ncbi:TPA: hypothetical protein QCU60_004325 [Bacillus cereus]|nr:hypothetical protein [Bacillus cereus]HDR6312339.1 hypothetical protein [Bacillus cereus]
MGEKKRKIQITLTEREIAKLEHYGEKSEVVSKLLAKFLENPDHLLTEEEMRECGKYKLYMKYGSIFLDLPYSVWEMGWDDELEEEGLEEIIRTCTYRLEDGVFKEYNGVAIDEFADDMSKALEFFEEEIYHFAKILEKDQFVVDGRLIRR